MVAVPTAWPSTENATLLTPTLSVALAVIATEPDSGAPLAGAVIDTFGGVVSTGAVLPKSKRNISLPFALP